MVNTNCFGCRETINNDNSISYDCKVLEEMRCDNCSFAKTHEAYNARMVEDAVRKYGEGVGQC